MLHSYENRTWRTERRRALPRILGWIVAVTPFCALMAMVLWGEWLIKLAREYQS